MRRTDGVDEPRRGAVRAYRALLLLYPRAFRVRFGAEMVQVFRAQLERRGTPTRRRSAAGVWLLVAGDVARTAPRQRLESSMSRVPPRGRSAVLVLLALVSAFVVLLIGSRVPFVLPISALALVVLVVRRRRELRLDAGVPWFAFVAGGTAALGLLVLGDRLVPDVSGVGADLLWLGAVGLLISGWLLVLTGVALGLLAGWRRLRTAAP